MTTTNYIFTQEIDYPDTLTANIKASAISSANLSYINTDGSGPTMQVTIAFSGQLSNTDITLLNNLLSQYVNQPLTSATQTVDTADTISVLPQYIGDNETLDNICLKVNYLPTTIDGVLTVTGTIVET